MKRKRVPLTNFSIITSTSTTSSVFLVDTLGIDVFLMIVDYLGPIHLMSLTRAYPSIRTFFERKRKQTIYQICIGKLHYYMVECSTTRLLSEMRWGSLMNPRNLNDYVLAGGEYLRRALTYTFPLHKKDILMPKFLGRISAAEFSDEFLHYIRMLDWNSSIKQSFIFGDGINYTQCVVDNMKDKRSLLQNVFLLPVERSYVGYTDLCILDPKSILHDKSHINWCRHDWFVNGNYVTASYLSRSFIHHQIETIYHYAGMRPEHSIAINLQAIYALVESTRYENLRDYMIAFKEWEEIWAKIYAGVAPCENVTLV